MRKLRTMVVAVRLFYYRPESSDQWIRQIESKLAKSALLLVVALWTPMTLHGQVCNPSSSLSLLPGVGSLATGRHKVLGDYFTIEYNANTRQTYWFDYHHSYDPNSRDKNPQPVGRNGSFLPVVYSKEKIAVHVCGLRFTDQLTVTTSPLAVPEGGADIRGTAPITLTPVTATLDNLQNASAGGMSAPQSGVGFTTTPQLPGMGVSVVTPGNRALEGTSTYTAASITASGQEVALMLYAFKTDADALSKSIEASERHIAPGQQHIRPGSIDFINDEIVRVKAKIAADLAESDFASDSAAFDQNVSEIQGLAAELTTLASSMSTLGYGARAVTLQNNYAALLGIIDLIEQGTQQQNCKTGPITVSALTAAKISQLTPAQVASLLPEEIGAFSDAQFKALKANQLTALSPAQIQALTTKQLSELTKTQAGGLTPAQVQAVTSDQAKVLAANAQAGISGALAVALAGPHADPLPPDDRPKCGRFEEARFQEFMDAFDTELVVLKQNKSTFLTDAAQSRDGMFNALSELRSDLESIDNDTGVIFSEMNCWYQSSSVEQTDTIAPANGNAIMRISIVVNRNFTPFTLSNNAAATTTAPPAAVAPSGASTSTPAHTVKTMSVEVHRLANFNLTGGVVLIHVPNTTYAVVPGTTATFTITQSNPTTPPTTPTTTYTFTGVCGGVQGTIATNTYDAPPTTQPSIPAYSCIVQTGESHWQLAGMVGLTWYPFGRDYFPRHNGYSNYGRNYIPSLMLATSVTSLGTALGAINFEPVTGINFFAGIASAKTNVLSAGYLTTTVIPGTYTLPGTTQLGYGFAAGIGLDFGVFGQLFSKPAGVLQ